MELSAWCWLPSLVTCESVKGHFLLCLHLAWDLWELKAVLTVFFFLVVVFPFFLFSFFFSLFFWEETARVVFEFFMFDIMEGVGSIFGRIDLWMRWCCQHHKHPRGKAKMLSAGSKAPCPQTEPHGCPVPAGTCLQVHRGVSAGVGATPSPLLHLLQALQWPSAGPRGCWLVMLHPTPRSELVHLNWSLLELQVSFWAWGILSFCWPSKKPTNQPKQPPKPLWSEPDPCVDLSFWILRWMLVSWNRKAVHLSTFLNELPWSDIQRYVLFTWYTSILTN